MAKGILLTTYKGREDDCAQEVWYILSRVGYNEFEVLKFNMPGLVLLKTNFEPVKAVEELIKFASEKVWSIRYILKAIPIETIVKLDREEIIAAAISLASKIEEGYKYRISITRRNAQISTKELIERIASRINRKVDLENFDYIILIEILSEYAGISVIKREQIFFLHKIRQKAIKELVS